MKNRVSTPNQSIPIIRRGETRFAHRDIARQNSQLKVAVFDTRGGGPRHNPGTFLAQIWHKRFAGFVND
jgi:hypothetical protein